MLIPFFRTNTNKKVITNSSIDRTTRIHANESTADTLAESSEKRPEPQRTLKSLKYLVEILPVITSKALKRIEMR